MARKYCNTLKTVAIITAASLTVGASAACAGNVGVDVNIHLGNPAPVIVPAPVPPTPPAPVPAFVIEQDVNFILPAPLGFYVAVGVPYDLFFVGNQYYLFRDGRWFMAPSGRGPWVVTRRRDLPPGLRRQRIEYIRSVRKSEYDVYRRDGEHYRGRQFRAAKNEWKEERKEARERLKEERREEKERWKEEKREEKERRKDERREDREDRDHGRGRGRD